VYILSVEIRAGTNIKNRVGVLIAIETIKRDKRNYNNISNRAHL